MKTEIIALFYSTAFGFTISMGFQAAPTINAVYFFLAFLIAGITYFLALQTIYLERLTRQ